MRDTPPMYRIRLAAANTRRKLLRWTLLRLFSWFVRITKRQLSLLTQRETALRELRTPGLTDERRTELRTIFWMTNLRLPMTLQSPSQQDMLEDLQLVCRAISTDLRETRS